MGVVRFLIPRRDRVSSDVIDRAYMAGIEGIPWHVQIQFDSDTLLVTREESESGYFYIPWRVDGYGELMLSTTSLIERDRPYHLPIELARGTINRIRNQLAAWKLAGLSVPREIMATCRRAATLLARAVLSQADREAALDLAEEALRISAQVIQDLMSDYTQQVLEIRHQQSLKLPTVFGAHLGSSLVGENRANLLLAAFNSAVVGMSWSQIETNSGEFKWNVYDQQVEWCRRRAVRVLSGPLVQLDQRTVPDWLFLWEDDFESLQSHVLAYVQAAVKRYHGKVTLWNCAGRMNINSAFRFTEEQRLNLTVRAIETVRQIEPRTPLIVSLDQPWGEYVVSNPLDLPPIQFADTLARADLGLSGFGLEINVGYWPGGTLSRDLLEFSTQLDRWSLLGLPLVIFLTSPSGTHQDPHALEGVGPLEGLAEGGPSLESQRVLYDRLVQLLLTKPNVQGIIWNQLFDSEQHDYPHGGLFDGDGQPKPALDALTTIRQHHLI